MSIQVIHAPSEAQLAELGVRDWPIWEKENASFPWTYATEETCFFLAGEVTVTPEGAAPVRMGKGDLVTFPAGMHCVWDISTPVRKHYRFG